MLARQKERRRELIRERMRKELGVKGVKAERREKNIIRERTWLV